MTLSQRLREETSQLHREVERAPFLRCFLKGTLDLEGFTEFLDALYEVYVALEEGLLQHGIGRLAPFARKELYRVPSLEKDLSFLRGADFGKNRKPAPAARAYTERLQFVSKDNPDLLIAHAYVRYLGDLAGGQALRRIAEKAFSEQVPDGFSFFDFPLIANPRDFMNDFRVALDTFPTSESLTDKIVSEAKLAFTLNGDLFAGLEPSLKARIGSERFEQAQVG